MKKGQRRPSPALSLLAPGQERALCCMQSSRVDDQAVWTLLLELPEGLSKTTGRIRGRASQIQVSPPQLGPPETVFEAHGRPCPCRCGKDASSAEMNAAHTGSTTVSTMIPMPTRVVRVAIQNQDILLLSKLQPTTLTSFPIVVCAVS